MNPQRREKQAKPVEDTPDEPQASTLARMGLKSITDAEMDDVCDVLTDSLASLADLRAAGPPAVKELRRLRAEVAAKDAEIARLVKMERERWESAAKAFDLRCRNCDGTGSIILDITGQRGIKCPSCNGSGKGFSDKGATP